MIDQMQVPTVLKSEFDSLKAQKDWLDAEILRLAEFIATEVPGEPSQSQGAVDTAIRIIRNLQNIISSSNQKGATEA